MVDLSVKDKKEVSKAPDPGDSISGFIEYIEEQFEKRGIVLSKQAYTSLYLGVWTFIIIYVYSNKPITDYLAYSPAYGPLLYFLLIFLPKTKLYKKMFEKGDYDFECIMDNKIAYANIARSIEINSTKNPDKLIQSINHLITIDKFKVDIQLALLENYDKYSIQLVDFVAELLISQTFHPKAVSKYLSVANLDDKDITDLANKYKNYILFSFSLGRFKLNEMKDVGIKHDYYVAGYKTAKTIDPINKYYIVLFITLISIIVLMAYYEYITNILHLAIVIIIINIPSRLARAKKEKAIKNALLAENIKLDEIELKSFIGDIMSTEGL